MAKKHLKMCSTALISEMQIKTKMRCQLTPLRMAFINNLQAMNDGKTVEKKETILHCCWECKWVQPL